MPRVIQNKIGLDEFVERQVWTSFLADWKTLGPMIANQHEPQLHDIGVSYLTAKLQSCTASVTVAEENNALDHVIDLMDRIGMNATQGKLGHAYGLAHNLPGDAALRLHQAMGRRSEIEERYRYDPDSYRPAVLREMLVEAKTNRRGPRRNRDLDVAASRLARLYETATGKTATFSSERKLDKYGPPRSQFGLFAHAVFRALDPNISDAAVTTACRNAVRKSKKTT